MSDNNFIPDKNIQLSGKNIGANTTIKLSVKTAVWIIGLIFSFILTILTYSYFDLKKQVNETNKVFVEKVEKRVKNIETEVTNVRISIKGIEGDIKLILDRQNRDNPIQNSNASINPVTPPELALDE